MLFILIGKSGTGKTSISSFFPQFVSFTTRAKRKNEVDGVHYHFMDKNRILKEIEKFKQGDTSHIVEYGGYPDGNGNIQYYGTLRSEFDKKLQENPIVVNVAEFEGSWYMRNKYPDLVRLVWIETDESIRISRLQDRAEKETGEQKEELLIRIQEAHRNTEKEKCDYIIYNNDSVEEAVLQLKNLATF